MQVAQAAAAALSLGSEVDRQQDHNARLASGTRALTMMRRPTGAEEGDRLLGKMERRAAVRLFSSLHAANGYNNVHAAYVLNCSLCCRCRGGQERRRRRAALADHYAAKEQQKAAEAVRNCVQPFTSS